MTWSLRSGNDCEDVRTIHWNPLVKIFICIPTATHSALLYGTAGINSSTSGQIFCLCAAAAVFVCVCVCVYVYVYVYVCVCVCVCGWVGGCVGGGVCGCFDTRVRKYFEEYICRLVSQTICLWKYLEICFVVCLYWRNSVPCDDQSIFVWGQNLSC